MSSFWSKGATFISFPIALNVNSKYLVLIKTPWACKVCKTIRLNSVFFLQRLQKYNIETKLTDKNKLYYSLISNSLVS